MSTPQPSPDEPTAFRPPEETPTVVVGERERRALQFTPGTIVGGRYRIVSLIGSGGMGEVYRADDMKLGHDIALKFVPASEETLREVRAGREIAHPNVCRIYDVVDAGDQAAIVMEFIDGEELSSTTLSSPLTIPALSASRLPKPVRYTSPGWYS